MQPLLQNLAKNFGQNPIFNLNSNHIKKETAIWNKRIFEGVSCAFCAPGDRMNAKAQRHWDAKLYGRSTLDLGLETISWGGHPNLRPIFR